MPKFQHTKEFYLANQGKKVKVRNFEATVGKNTTSGQSGSWERGFKFHESTYGMLVRKLKSIGYTQFSFDGGKTWGHHVRDIRKATKKGKIKLDKTKTHSELAFEGIQRINREYDPNYKWKP
jgi:hypothetical protein